MATTTWQRGRYAESPQEIPAAGWKDTLIRVKNEVSEDRVSMIAAAMAYYSLLALVPAITSIILIYAWVSDPAEISGHVSSMSQFLPAEMQNILKDQLTTLSSQAPTALGLSAIASLLFSLWSASKGSTAIIDGLNVVYGEKNDRGFIKSTFIALTFTLLAAVLMVLAIGVIVGIPAFFGQFNLNPLFKTAVTAASWVVLLGIFSFYLSFIYRYAPNRNQPKWKWVSWGAVIASILWAIVSALFSWYATQFGDFNKTYGSLGAVIVLMMWFYLSSFVVLLGGEINAELEHQTKKDTTKGAERPMGQRDARMADTLGPSAKS